jgi:threonine synthase
MKRSYLTTLECSRCGEQADPAQLNSVCPACGKVLFARYDLEAASKVMTKESLMGREKSMWRYREVMPVLDDANIVSLGEGMTPLLHTERLGKTLGLNDLYIKDEGFNPTGSFKARGMSAAVSRAREMGVTSIAIPSAGNAAAAIAAYCARAGINATVFMPVDAPDIAKGESKLAGARVYLVNGLIGDAGRIVKENREQHGWWDISTLKEPYRAEGKKTMGYELAEQFNWSLPDVIVYPTGGGTGIVGMWKAFEEMEMLGWIDSKRPRMVAVQTEGCAPIVRAFERGDEFAEPIKDAHTIASGLRVPGAIGDYLILDALRSSGGTAVRVADSDLAAAMHEIGRWEGISSCLEGAATLVGLRVLVERGQVGADETIVLLNTGSALTTPQVLEAEFPVWEE